MPCKFLIGLILRYKISGSEGILSTFCLKHFVKLFQDGCLLKTYLWSANLSSFLLDQEVQCSERKYFQPSGWRLLLASQGLTRHTKEKVWGIGRYSMSPEPLPQAGSIPASGWRELCSYRGWERAQCVPSPAWGGEGSLEKYQRSEPQEEAPRWS